MKADLTENAEKNRIRLDPFQVDGIQKQGAKEALALAQSADRVVVTKGKRVTTFDMAKARPDDATLVARLLNSTGHLRTPTIRKGHTLLVGFNEDIYQRYLSG